MTADDEPIKGSSSGNPNQQPARDAERMFMSRPEFVLVARFKIPAESVLSERPKHKVWCDFSRNGVHFDTVCVRMNPLGANPDHELHLVGNRPRLLEEKVYAPFGRVTAEQRRDPSLKFEPVLYRCGLNSDSGTKTRLTFRQASGGGGSNLNHCGRFFVTSLREGVCSAEKQTN